MDERFRRSLKTSTIVHGIVLLAAIVAPLIFNWRTQRKKKEIVQFVEFTVALPENPAVKPVNEIRAPEPPKPKPEAPENDIPEPEKKAKPKIEKSTKKIKRDPPKPKTPPLSEAEIRKLLAQGAKISDKTSIPTGDALLSWYYAVVRQTMYDAWEQPSGLGGMAGLTAEMEIRVSRDGTITRRRMTRPSGNAVMDESVKRAVDAVTRLKPLPAEFTGEYRDITIEFELAR